eukprot:10050355-Alexandrium_andersonii.AAC.1
MPGSATWEVSDFRRLLAEVKAVWPSEAAWAAAQCCSTPGPGSGLTLGYPDSVASGAVQGT